MEFCFVILFFSTENLLEKQTLLRPLDPNLEVLLLPSVNSKH